MKKPILISIAGLLVVGGIVFCIVKKPFNQNANADPLTNPTQIEQTIEDETETQESSENTTQESSENTQESTTESSTQENTTESTNQEETQDENQDNTVSYHTETQTVHHDAEYTIVHHDAEYKTVHHDAVTHQETVTTYTTEQQWVPGAHHDAVTDTVEVYSCCDCGAEFGTDHGAAMSHLRDTDHSGLLSRYSTITISEAYDDPGHYENVQVPHTETIVVVDQEAYDEKVLVKEAYDEKVLVRDAWDEEVKVQVPNN